MDMSSPIMGNLGGAESTLHIRGREPLIVAAAAFVWAGLWAVLAAACPRRFKEGTEKVDGEKYDGEAGASRWAQHGMSECHAISATIAAGYSLAWQPEGAAICTASDAWRDMILLSSAGYFLCDFALELARKRQDYPILFHHVFAGGFFVLAVYQEFFTDALAVLLITEGSTVFLNIRWLLKRMQKSGIPWTEQYQQIELCNNVIFAVTFLFCRVLFVPAIWWQNAQQGCLQSTQGSKGWVAWCANVNFPVLWAMNLIWFHMIVKSAMKMGSQPKSMGDKCGVEADDSRRISVNPHQMEAR